MVEERGRREWEGLIEERGKKWKGLVEERGGSGRDWLRTGGERGKGKREGREEGDRGRERLALESLAWGERTVGEVKLIFF